MLKKLLFVLATLLATQAFAAVDANQATLAELENVKGIGPSVAAQILETRKKSQFKDWNDMIDRVKGVGAGSAKRFSANGLTVNGAEFKGAAPAPKSKANTSQGKVPAMKDEKK